MKADKLVKMANEIASFFESDPDRTLAAESIAGHLKRFWDPRMRRELLAWVDDHAGEGLKPIVLETIATHRANLQPAEGRPAPEPPSPGS